MALLNTKLDEIKRQKETYLKPQNIKQGIEVMGIEGNMVDTTAGDALASNIAKGKVAYVGNKEVVGTLDFDVGQVVAGVDEMKKVYENVPNTFEYQEYNTSIYDYPNYGNESNGGYPSIYCDKDYPFILKACIYCDYGSGKTNDCQIRVYDKSFKLIDNHSLLADLNMQSFSSTVGTIKITGLLDIYDNVYMYFGFYASTIKDSYILYKYNTGTNKFEICQRGGSSPFGTYRGATPMIYVPSKKGYLYPAATYGLQGKCLYVENGEITQKSLSGRIIDSSSSMADLRSGPLLDYDIIGTKGGVLIKFQQGSDTSFTGVQKSLSGIKDICNGYIVCQQSGSSYNYLYFYSYDENLSTITQLFTYSLRDVIDCMFVSTDTLLVVYYSSSKYYLRLYRIDYENKTLIQVKSELLSSSYSYTTMFWLTETTILIFKLGAGTYTVVDVSEGTLKLVYAEDDNGERYYRYDNASTLEDLSNILEGSGSVIYRNGLGNGTMPNKGNQVFTPTISQQTLQTGYYNGATISPVTSSIDSNITPENIKSGVRILGVQGSLDKASYSYIGSGYTVKNIQNDYTYQFDYNNSTGYYTSNNKGKASSFAYCKVNLYVADTTNITISYISNGESNYDYGVFSNLDTNLVANYTDYTTNVYKSCRGESSTAVKTLTYNQVPAGNHYITIKYVKDSSGDSGNDSLQFKFDNATSENEVYTKIYGSIEEMQNDTNQLINTYALIYDTTNTKMSSLYKWNGTAWVLSEDIKPTNSALMFATVEEMEAYENPSEDQYAIVYGTTYIGTYRYDNNNWVQIGNSTQEQEIMDVLNDVMNTTDQYEGKGGTDEQINSVLDDILGE